MFGILVALFTIVPAIEIYLLIKVGSAIGGFNTIMIVIITGIFGASLAKSQGISILNRIQKDLADGKLPADQIIHGFLVFGGGLLLLTPGFFTDLIGLSMVFPGSRHLYIAILKDKVKSGLESGTIKFTSFHSGFSGGFSSGASSTNTYHSTHEQFNHDESKDNEIQNDDNVIEADFTKKE